VTAEAAVFTAVKKKFKLDVALTAAFIFTRMMMRKKSTAEVCQRPWYPIY